MPTIQSVLRLQIDGGQNLSLVKRETLKVDSCEQFTLSVDAVPLQKKARKGAKKKPEKHVGRATYKPKLSNVKFVAIYDGGQGRGLKLRIGNSKPVQLTEPIILMGRSAATLNSNAKIVLENDSQVQKKAVMLVGSDLPKVARKFEVVKLKPTR